MNKHSQWSWVDGEQQDTVRFTDGKLEVDAKRGHGYLRTVASIGVPKKDTHDLYLEMKKFYEGSTGNG